MQTPSNKVNQVNAKKKRFVIVKRSNDKVLEYEEGQVKQPMNRLAEYISQLSEQELIVMKIASEHLKTSFDIEKSSGYLQYLLK
jgi:hypothetical protein